MNYKELLKYLETNLDGYETFMRKAYQFQAEKNLKRPAKSRWDDDKLNSATYDMWKKSMEPLYNNLKKEVKSDLQGEWTSYIDKNGILEIINDGISEIDFSGEG